MRGSRFDSLSSTFNRKRHHQKSTEVLQVGPEGRWFRLGDDERVELRTRRAPRLILVALVEHSLVEPNARGEAAALSVEDLVSAGWPGQRMVVQAGADRVYTAVGTLRQLGLKDRLQRRDEGYLLQPALHIVRSNED